ncbi:unnamed protein product [Urochloa decumbens]|uniref:F-box domain-containing protein n=1 Tax=Urochloa decumbens TaxID=240449 RepID=A0ABC8WDI4_9POAL
MAAAARRIPIAAAAAQPVLPDEILEEIFMRLDSAACSSFFRVVSARMFLRRFRSLHHPPPVLGILNSHGFQIPRRARIDQFFPAEPPHRSASAARALARAADFTFSFLPDARYWTPHDCRDGRVLLSRRISYSIDYDDLVVCDPLHRRYVMTHDSSHTRPPDAGEDEGDESSFRVFCTMRFGDEFMAFFFSSANQKWELVTNHSSSYFGRWRCYAHGCFFWMEDSRRSMLMLDTREMKFSIIDLPPNNNALNDPAIVEAGEGRLGLLTLVDGAIDLSCKIIWRSNGVDTEGWQRYKVIPLTKDSDGKNYEWWSIMDAEGCYVSLVALRSHHNDSEYFVLDLKTMLLERLFVGSYS